LFNPPVFRVYCHLGVAVLGAYGALRIADQVLEVELDTVRYTQSGFAMSVVMVFR
jgi:hypothetical protein